MTAGANGALPLHVAAQCGHEAVVQMLLVAAPTAAVAANVHGSLPLHVAVQCGHEAVAHLLVQAAPSTAASLFSGRTALQLALANGHTAAARPLLSAGSAAALLAVIASDGTPALFADFLLAAGRLALSAADWELIPSPCPGLGAALHAALACSAEQASQLVRRLPAEERARLRVAALCLCRRGLPRFEAALVLVHVVS